MNDKRLSYKEAGVDIDAGDALVEAIKPLAKGTNRAGVTSGIGGFGALFDVKAAGFKDPILVSGTDGVGTKLAVAIAANKHDTIGIDLVAMCVNDLVVQGAEPLFFLDYFASGKLDVTVGTEIVKGIARGCKMAGCALIGGETAEMPGLYRTGDYDLAGFAVGAVERDEVITGISIRKDHVVLGLASSGVHSNGYSLVRRLVADAGADYAAPAPFDSSQNLGTALLEPTKIYVQPLLKAIKAGGVHGLAHITGGGLLENIPRVLPDGLGVRLDAKRWTLPPVFSWMMKTANIAPTEMARTFNCGIGMVAIVPQDRAEPLSKILREAGETVSAIGRVIVPAKGDPAVVIDGMDERWPG